MSLQIDYNKTCFVIMPFSKKEVDGVEIDFDNIYDTIFAPAIAAVDLPEGGKLIPKRTDKDYASGIIDIEMHSYLEYSRFALVDITGLNANVFYELGIRHHANQSGTAIFRQGEKAIPFDIKSIKAFPYEYQPSDKIKESQQLITKVLTDSLLYNRIDSPVQAALNASRQLDTPAINSLLTDATNAIRNDDFNTAIDKYRQALQKDGSSPVRHLELGLLLKKVEKWADACQSFDRATKLQPDYSEAWRELGIAQNKLFNKAKDNTLPDGLEALKKSIELKPDDFDALASLGGIYKRMENWTEAAAMYERSLEASNGHPYPLLNGLILKIKLGGIAAITGKDKIYLKRAEVPLRKQVADTPPYNAPWSFFDLSTICLLLGRDEEAMKILEDGLVNAKGWETDTHYKTMLLIEHEQANIKGLQPVLELLKELAP